MFLLKQTTDGYTHCAKPANRWRTNNHQTVRSHNRFALGTDTPFDTGTTELSLTCIQIPRCSEGNVWFCVYELLA